MMRPQPAACMAGRARRVVWNALVRLMAMMASQRWFFFFHLGGHRADVGGLAHLFGTVVAHLYAQCGTSALAPSTSPKPLSMMLAPWLARALAMPRPMPLVEPVTRGGFVFQHVVAPIDLRFTHSGEAVLQASSAPADYPRSRRGPSACGCTSLIDYRVLSSCLHSPSFASSIARFLHWRLRPPAQSPVRAKPEHTGGAPHGLLGLACQRSGAAWAMWWCAYTD